MKRLFLAIVSIALLSNIYALDTSCLLVKSQPINISPWEIIQVENYFEIYPIQGGEIAPVKKLSTTQTKQYFDYSVAQSTGFKNPNFPYISDNDSSTFIQFSENPKSITLKLNTPVTAGDFNFSLDADIFDLAEIEISDDGRNFQAILLSDIEYFSFWYIRLSFVDRLKNSTTTLFAPTKIRDILFSKKELQTYLIKSISSEPISVYTQLNCENPDINRELSAGYQAAEKTKMSINVNTRKVDIVMEKNNTYNPDKDGDGISNNLDNCALENNKDQKDTDKDLIGDVCDINPKNRNPLLGDSDYDGVDDETDNCPFMRNPGQEDENSNGRWDACSDDDGDGWLGYVDNCPSVPNADQRDVNVNNIGDVCESDRDKDGFFDAVDVCPWVINPDQADTDSDGIGDMCDNCNRYNPDQRDENNDWKWDTCSEWETYEKSHDDDKDGVINWDDSCPKIANPKIKMVNPKTNLEEIMQPDKDYDGIGDMCDNCVDIQNTDQADTNKNKQGDMCEDIDGDGRQSYQDNCPLDSNVDQADKNNDGVGDLCDDTDGDSIRASIDNCPYLYNPEQLDSDNDMRGDKCDDKDDRFLESNRGIFVAIFAIIGIGMLIGIIVLGKKLLSSH